VSKSKVRIEGTIENKCWSNTWVNPKTVFETYPNQKNSPLGLQKVKNDPKTKSKFKVVIEESLKIKRCLSTWVQPKTVFESYLDPKNNPIGLLKDKNNPKLSQIQRLGLKKT